MFWCLAEYGQISVWCLKGKKVIHSVCFGPIPVICHKTGVISFSLVKEIEIKHS